MDPGDPLDSSGCVSFPANTYFLPQGRRIAEKNLKFHLFFLARSAPRVSYANGRDSSNDFQIYWSEVDNQKSKYPKEHNLVVSFSM